LDSTKTKNLHNQKLNASSSSKYFYRTYLDLDFVSQNSSLKTKVFCAISRNVSELSIDYFLNVLVVTFFGIYCKQPIQV